MSKNNNLIRRTTNGFVPNIIRGGLGMNIGDNMFLMKGKTHDNGGIDIGKSLEVENNEIVQINPNNVKVFSAKPFLGGYSPSQLVLNGNNPEQVFALQEKYKPKDNKENKAGFGTYIINKLKSGKNNVNDLIKAGLTLHYGVDDIESDTVAMYTDGNGPYSLVIDNNHDTRGKYNYINEFMNMNNANMYIRNNNGEYELADKDKILKEIRPKLDYLQGDYDMIPIIDKDNYIVQMANEYGINPNILARRLVKEGVLDKLANKYNNEKNKQEQQDLIKNNFYFYNSNFSTYSDLGLDTFLEKFKNKKINIKNKELNNKLLDILKNDDYMLSFNEKGTDIMDVIINGKDAIEMYAAYIKFLQDNYANKEIYKDINKDSLINAMFNLGENHKDLTNKNYIEKTYEVPDYYKINETSKQNKEQKDMAYGGLSPLSQGQLIVYNPFSTGKSQQAVTIGNNQKRTKAENGGIKWSALEWNTLGGGLASLAGNLLSGIGSSVIGKRIRNMYDNMKRTSTYVPIAREHISTNVDVNPQLDAINNLRHQINRTIDINTNNSRDAINRKRSLGVNSLAQMNAVYADKLNRETQLRNAEAELQTKYNMIDNQNKINDINAQNDFEMQRQVGKINASNQEAATWIQDVQNMIGDANTVLNNYNRGLLALAGSQNKELSDEALRRLFPWLIKQ